MEYDIEAQAQKNKSSSYDFEKEKLRKTSQISSTYLKINNSKIENKTSSVLNRVCDLCTELGMKVGKFILYKFLNIEDGVVEPGAHKKKQATNKVLSNIIFLDDSPNDTMNLMVKRVHRFVFLRKLVKTLVKLTKFLTVFSMLLAVFTLVYIFFNKECQFYNHNENLKPYYYLYIIVCVINCGIPWILIKNEKTYLEFLSIRKYMKTYTCIWIVIYFGAILTCFFQPIIFINYIMEQEMQPINSI